MVIKRYLVENMNEALTRIKYELGRDAIIISKRKVRKPGILGLFSGKLLEVTAAIENSQEEPKMNYKKEEEFKASLDSIRKISDNQLPIKDEQPVMKNEFIEKFKASLSEAEKKLNKNNNFEKENTNIKDTKSDIDKISSDVTAVNEEVSEIKNLLNKIIKNTSKDDGASEISEEIEKQLEYFDIDEEFFEEIINRVKENENKTIDIKEILRSIFEGVILESTANLNGKVVLVGPTGVGKTTTIAKLAGRLALIEKRRVGLITVDTYRIGAIEQLKTYAEIMNIPFKVVITMKEMEDAIEDMSGCDVILIDTTGRSSKNTMQISELRAFIKKANPNYISMVISATTKNKDIKSILDGYSELEYDNVIITKLDETTAYGSLYNIAKRASKPINFITIGQNVPEDIKVPTKQKIARFILGEENLC